MLLQDWNTAWVLQEITFLIIIIIIIITFGQDKKRFIDFQTGA